MIWVRLPGVRRQPRVRARQCAYCGSFILQRWGRAKKPIQDTHALEVIVQRYRCCDCGRTFRDYPDGVDQADRSRPVRQLAALTWALGLSVSEVVDVLAGLGLQMGRTTIWRDGRAMIERLPEGRRESRASILSADPEEPWLERHRGGEVLVLELKREKCVCLELEGDTSEPMDTWLGPMLEEMGMEVEVI